MLRTNLCVSVVTSSLWIWDMAGSFSICFTNERPEVRVVEELVWGHTTDCVGSLTNCLFYPSSLRFFCFDTYRHTPTNVPHQLQCYQKESQMNTKVVLGKIPCIHHFSSLQNTMHEVGTAHTRVCAMFQSYDVWTEACKRQYSTCNGPYSTIASLDKPANEDTYIQRD